MSKNKVINFYQATRAYGYFSNFAKYPIILKNKTWPTTEHYFQAQKFAGTEFEEQIRLLKYPAEAAKMGRDRSLPLRKDWEEVKEDIMREALYAKFTQHDSLRHALLLTEDAKLIEHTKNDSYWGDGGDGSGKNRLGILLMELREKLKSNKPMVGSIAICGIGCVGLITEEYPQDVSYGGKAYVGIHLTNKVSPIGSPWSSRKPKIIGHIDDLTAKLEETE